MFTPKRGGSDRIPILYLTGRGRSGTTLLSRLLDLEPGYRAVGEVRSLTDTKLVPCGCGKSQFDCDFWAPILERVSAPEAKRAWETAMRARQVDQARALVSPSYMSSEARRTSALLHAVYEDLAAGGQIVVDESKTPWNGYLLASQPWADVRFVELVRNPSDVVRSRTKVKNYQKTTPSEVEARYWLRTCLTNEVMRRRLKQPWYRVAFTELANEPQRVLGEILGRPTVGISLEDGVWSFESPVTHIFRSNSDKLRRGPDAVRPVLSSESASSTAGPWEKLANRYWDTCLAGRIAVRQRWPAPQLTPAPRSGELASSGQGPLEPAGLADRGARAR